MKTVFFYIFTIKTCKLKKKHVFNYLKQNFKTLFFRQFYFYSLLKKYDFIKDIFNFLLKSYCFFLFFNINDGSTKKYKQFLQVLTEICFQTIILLYNIVEETTIILLLRSTTQKTYVVPLKQSNKIQIKYMKNTQSCQNYDFSSIVLTLILRNEYHCSSH